MFSLFGVETFSWTFQGLCPACSCSYKTSVGLLISPPGSDSLRSGPKF